MYRVIYSLHAICSSIKTLILKADICTYYLYVHMYTLTEDNKISEV